MARSAEEPEALRLVPHPAVSLRLARELQAALSRAPLLTPTQLQSTLLPAEALARPPHAFFLGHGPGVGKTRVLVEARLRLRGLPAGPFSGIVLALLERAEGPETPTVASAAMLGRTALEIHADELDEVSPARDARAIAAACPGATLHLTRGVAHADLGTEIGTWSSWH